MLTLIYRAADALRRRSLVANHGRMGEDLAHRYLRGRGCTVVARNYRPPSGHGEIDLVAWQGENLVFVEVKTGRSRPNDEPDPRPQSNRGWARSVRTAQAAGHLHHRL